MKREIWHPVRDWEELYEVSNKGRVRSLDRTIHVVSRLGNPFSRDLPGRILRPSRGGPYQHVNLADGERRYSAKIHWLVAEAFHGPRPEGYVACHNNGNSHDNRAENLRWDTQSENLKDMVRQGRFRNQFGRQPHLRGVAVVAAFAFLALVAAAPASAGDDTGHKVWICHSPPGNPDAAHSIHVDAHSWNGHKNHKGDYVGKCKVTPTPTEPTTVPTTVPTVTPTTEPTTEPTVEPTTEPTTQPTQEPTTPPGVDAWTLTISATCDAVTFSHPQFKVSTDPEYRVDVDGVIGERTPYAWGETVTVPAPDAEKVTMWEVRIFAKNPALGNSYQQIGTRKVFSENCEPVTEPTTEPTVTPTTEPTQEPTAEPTVEPSEPVTEPTTTPTEPVAPTVEPTVVPAIGDYMAPIHRSPGHKADVSPADVTTPPTTKHLAATGARETQLARGLGFFLVVAGAAVLLVGRRTR